MALKVPNHLHLLVKDTGPNVIAQSMQPDAGRTAQEYNECKNRHREFWEDRYHATAIEADEHRHRCLIYIDLNMVRTGVVNHPSKWVHSGHREIQRPPKRYAIIDLPELSALCGFNAPTQGGLSRRFQSAEFETTVGRNRSRSGD